MDPLSKEGLSRVQNKEGLYGFIDRDGNLVIDFQFQEATDFERGYASVKDATGKQGVIDTSGKVVIPIHYDAVRINWNDTIHVKKYDSINHRNLYGIYDMHFGYVLPCIYERLCYLKRNRDGIVICEVKKFDESEEVEVMVNTVTFR